MPARRPETACLLKNLLRERKNTDDSDRPVFMNRHGRGLTRFGLYKIVRRHAEQIVKRGSDGRCRNISPHLWRHSTAVHLLEACVEVNVIRAWLGHINLETTNRYIEQYRTGLVPLIVPITLIRHYVRKDDQPYLMDQHYLNPDSVELQLRNHVCPTRKNINPRLSAAIKLTIVLTLELRFKSRPAIVTETNNAEMDLAILPAAMTESV